MKKKMHYMVIGVIFYIVALFLIWLGFDKMQNYQNSEYYSLSKNAYVKGDAYNYIINGTYFTGYSVLGVGSAIIGTILIVNHDKVTFEEMTKFSLNKEIENKKSETN